MKKLNFYLFTTIFVLFISNIVLSQVFIVKVPITDDYLGYLKPIKAGNSCSLAIDVINKNSVACNLTLQKANMGLVSPWVTMENEGLYIGAGKSVSYNLTIKVPSNTFDGKYELLLKFAGKDANDNIIEFEYAKQFIIVDNSVPDAPTVSLSVTSTSIKLADWKSYDIGSEQYTKVNGSSGYKGIESFLIEVIDLSNPNPVNSFKEPYKSGQFTSITNNLKPNYNYKVNLTATDLAGNINTTTLTTLTAPAPPVVSVKTNRYCSVTLQWPVVAGATSYLVYKSAADNTPVQTDATEYTITGLTPNTPNQFIVKAKNGTLISDDATINVTTLSLPKITGDDKICSYDKSYNFDSNIPNGVTIEWQTNTGLNISSGQGTSVVSVYATPASSGYYGWLKAKLTDNGCVNEITKNIWQGTPAVSSVNPLAYYTPGVYNSVCNNQNYTTSFEISGSNNTIWSRLQAYPTSTNWYQSGNNITFSFWNVNQTAVYRVEAINDCGVTSYDFGFKSIQCSNDPCKPSYTLSPNPAKQKTKVVIGIIAPCDYALTTQSFNGYISVYDNKGVLKKRVNYKKYEDVEIDLSGLQNGMHYLEIYDGTSVEKKSILIQN